MVIYQKDFTLSWFHCTAKVAHVDEDEGRYFMEKNCIHLHIQRYQADSSPATSAFCLRNVFTEPNSAA
jgi:hypothetical protein